MTSRFGVYIAPENTIFPSHDVKAMRLFTETAPEPWQCLGSGDYTYLAKPLVDATVPVEARGTEQSLLETLLVSVPVAFLPTDVLQVAKHMAVALVEVATDGCGIRLYAPSMFFSGFHTSSSSDLMVLTWTAVEEGRAHQTVIFIPSTLEAAHV